MKSPVIQVNHVSKKYLLEKPQSIKTWASRLFHPFKMYLAIYDISLTVNKGEFVLITGPNGAGKTTLLKLIAGISEPTTGTITTKGKVVPLIELGAGFNHELSGRENILINATIFGIEKNRILHKTSSIAEFAGTESFLDIPLKRYSSGMISRLAFAIAVFSEPDILLLDETLAVGDRAFWKKSIAKIENLRKIGVTIVWVSHFENYFNTHVDRIIRIKKVAQ